jgi:hypothetical protein
MPRKPLGDRPLTAAERQARARDARAAACQEAQAAVPLLRAALSKISDRTSERMRTKADLQAAVDQIGVLAADALAETVQ